MDVGREEIRGDKIYQKRFLNSLKEIAQRSEFRGSENTVRSRPGRARSTGVHDLHRHSPIDTVARERSTGAVNRLAQLELLLVPVDRGTRLVDRADRPTGDLLS